MRILAFETEPEYRIGCCRNSCIGHGGIPDCPLFENECIDLFKQGCEMLFWIKIGIFLIVSAGLTWVSRSCLRNFRIHGFHRFFAWESILVLILLNIDYWFYKPVSVFQIISWVLLIISLYLVISGWLILHRKGKMDSGRSDPALIGIEKTTELITDGVYRYIRHPVYGSLLYLAWGVFFKHVTGWSVLLVFSASIFLTITARFEERENLKFFGPPYRDYMNRSKMFVPFFI